VTEAEWLAATDPRRMLRCVQGHIGLRGAVARALRWGGAAAEPRRASERQLRLFACACGRLVMDLITDERSRRAVEVAERFADGTASRAELEAATAEALAVLNSLLGRGWADGFVAHLSGRSQAALMEQSRPWIMAASAALETARAPDRVPEAAARAALAAGADWNNPDFQRWALAVAGPATHAALIRDIFGNPFRPAPVLDPAWLAWNGGTVRQLAAAAYEQRSLPDGTLDDTCLAALADALEEAGCTDAGILGHLRGPGPHVRGCWALDLVRDKS
jgi:hypothetical protein